MTTQSSYLVLFFTEYLMLLHQIIKNISLNEIIKRKSLLLKK